MFRLLTGVITTATIVIASISSAGASQAVIVEAAPEAEVGNIPDLSASLAQAFKNYLDYFLLRCDPEAAVYLATADDADDYLERLNRNPSITSLTHLSVAGRLEDLLSSYTNRRRVSRFVVRPGCLRLEVSFTTYKKSSGNLEVVDEGRLTEQARRRWLKYRPGDDVRRLDSLVAVTPEPHECVVRRAVERLFPSPCATSSAVVVGKNSIPTVIVVDSSFVCEFGEQWQSEVEALVFSASHLLFQEFGHTLDLRRIAADPVVEPAGVAPAERFHDFRRRYRPAADTLIIGLYSQHQPDDFFAPHETDAIGLSVTGERLMLLRQLSQARPTENLWQAQLNSLVLVHELGHVLGAIHVSDPSSIMCHNATWLAPGQFDDFNRQVVGAALNDDFDSGNPQEYLAFVSLELNNSPYHLVDYPPVLYRALAETNLLADPKIAVRTVGQSHLSAAEGFGKLVEGDRQAALELLSDAVRHDPRQACLPYYLAQALDGRAAVQALRQAAGLGYWHAQLLLQRLNSEALND